MPKFLHVPLIFSPTADDVIMLVSFIYGLVNCNLMDVMVKDKLAATNHTRRFYMDAVMPGVCD